MRHTRMRNTYTGSNTAKLRTGRRVQAGGSGGGGSPRRLLVLL